MGQRGARIKEELIDAKPFVEWLDKRHKALLDDDTIRDDRMTNSPAVAHLSAELGVSDRTLYRYMRSLDGVNRPTTQFRRSLIEDMLEHAGLRIDDVYPDLDPEIDLEPTAWCPTCEDAVTPINGECPWCSTRPGKAPIGVTYTRPRKRYITDHQLRSLHLLHTNCRLPIIELARQSYKRLGFASPGSCDHAIRRGWERLRLEQLPRSVVMRAWAARRPPRDVPVSNEDVEQAAWMHAECGVSVEAIGRLMVNRSRYSSSESLSRWFRDEFRRRGIYQMRRGQVPEERAA